MNKEKIRDMLSMWKTTNRLTFIAGMVACWMVLGISFVRPHVDRFLYISFFPGIFYALYYAYRIRKISKELDKIKTSLDTHEKRSTQ